MLMAPLVQAGPIRVNHQDSCAYRGEKRLLYTWPVWDLCSQHRAGPRLFRLPSSPISTPAVSVTSLEMQNEMWTLKTLRGFKPMFGLPHVGCCCYLGRTVQAATDALTYPGVLDQNMGDLLRVDGEGRAASWAVYIQELVCGRVLP